ncbi:hypothetical protein [Qipengyuania sp. MTN3-11]|uniref:hypothetical protein n=1 Tax=Qipengyuania sp. MTN3-11 TaxID=3056557 RepID=UPI0036F2C64B
MNFPEAIALCAIVVGIISLAGMWLDAHNTKVKNRTKVLELEVRKAEAERGAGVQRIGDVEERLRVLERIATDRNHMLADEIETLRDRPARKEHAA